MITHIFQEVKKVTVNKILKKGSKIIGYQITIDNLQIDIYADELKESVRKGMVELVNYTLTSDNRLAPKNKH